MPTSRICAVDGCDKQAVRLGWCSSHYRRALHHGSPTAGRTYRGSLGEFVQKAIGFRGTECLLWPYGTNPKGYGQFTQNGRKTLVHRFVCWSVNGEPPTQKHEAAHSCGIRKCVNPTHIRWATAIENDADKTIHGTRNIGERHGLSRLTTNDVLTIRALEGIEGRREIAEAFHIRPETVNHIQSRRSWKWLKDE